MTDDSASPDSAMSSKSESAKTAAFEQHRQRLVGLAYRMLGSLSEAEDVVQEAWLRWQRTDDVENAGRWLTTVTSRLAIDELRSAKRRREEYVGPWLPEPVADQPSDPAELADSLSMALLAVLERLTPSERAAFLLREVFDYEYSDVAGVLGKSEAACRQLVRRAKSRLEAERPRFEVSHRATEEMAARFVAAAEEGDLAPLEELLDRDVVLWADGGGKALAALKPIHGADKVARFFLGVWPKRPAGTRLELRRLNGEPALVATVGSDILQTMHFDLSPEGRLRAFFIVRNPDKLGRLEA